MERGQSTGAAQRNQKHGFPEFGRFTGVLFVYAGLFTIVSTLAFASSDLHAVAMVTVSLTFLYTGVTTIRNSSTNSVLPLGRAEWLLAVVYGALTIAMLVWWV